MKPQTTSKINHLKPRFIKKLKNNMVKKEKINQEIVWQVRQDDNSKYYSLEDFNMLKIKSGLKSNTLNGKYQIFFNIRQKNHFKNSYVHKYKIFINK